MKKVACENYGTEEQTQENIMTNINYLKIIDKKMPMLPLAKLNNLTTQGIVL